MDSVDLGPALNILSTILGQEISREELSGQTQKMISYRIDSHNKSSLMEKL